MTHQTCSIAAIGQEWWDKRSRRIGLKKPGIRWGMFFYLLLETASSFTCSELPVSKTESSRCLLAVKG